MKIYRVTRKSDNYTRAIFEDEQDAMDYIFYLDWLKPEESYYIERDVTCPKGYGSYWKDYATEQINKAI